MKYSAFVGDYTNVMYTDLCFVYLEQLRDYLI